MADWLKKQGADVEFLANDPKEAQALEAKFRANPQDASLVGRYRMVGEPQGAEASPDFTGRLKQWFTQAPEAGSIRGMIENAHPALQAMGAGQRAAAEYTLPGTNAGLATDIAAMAAPAIAPLRAGATALSNVAKVGARVAIPAAAGALGGSLEGGAEGAKTGAMQGGAAGLVGEAAGPMLPSALSAFYKKFGHFNTESMQRAVRNKIGPSIAKGIAEDIPSLGASTTMHSTSDLDYITQPEGGQKVMGKMFDKVEGQIVKTLGAAGQRIAMPFEALQATGRAGAKPTTAQVLASARAGGNVPNAAAPAQQVLQSIQGQQVYVDVTPAEAVRISKELRAKAFKGVQDATGQSMRELSDTTTTALMQAVQKHDPQLYNKYVGLREDYGKFLDVKDFFKGQNADLLPTMPDGGPTVDLPKMYDAMRETNSTIDKARFPNLWGAFEGGGAGGPVAAKSKSLPRIVAGGHARIAESIHVPGRTKLTPQLEETLGTKAKGQAYADKARPVGTVLSVPPIEQMLLDRQQESNQPLPSSMLK